MTNIERVIRNVETLKAKGANEVEVDCYVAAEGIKHPLSLGAQRIWHKPLAASLRNPVDVKALRQRYSLG